MADNKLIRKLDKVKLAEFQDRLDRITGHTRFNEFPSFSAAEVEILINHINELQKLLFQVAEFHEYELPYRMPPIILQSRDLKDKFNGSPDAA